MNKLFLLFLLNISGYNTYSQQYNFKHLGMDEGLLSSYVTGAMEDNRGYMWVATLMGIMRYDGKEFKEYGEKEGYTDVGAFKIYKDKGERLWFISFNYHLYYLENEHFYRCLPNELVGWIDEDKEGKMHAITRTGHLIQFTLQKIISDTQVSVSRCYYLKVLQSKDIMVTNVDNVLYLKKYQVNTTSFHKNGIVVARIFELKDGRILLCNEKGIYYFHPSNLSVTPAFLFHGYNEVVHCYEDPNNGTLWVATVKGLYRFRNGNIHTQIPEMVLKKVVSGIYKSRDGNMWFTTLGDGVYCCDFQSIHYLTNDRGIAYVKKQGEYIYAINPNSRVFVINNRKIVKLNYPGEGEQTNWMLSNSSNSDLPVYFQTRTFQMWKIDQGKVYSQTNFMEQRKQDIDKYLLFYINDKGRIYYSKMGKICYFRGKKFCLYPHNEKMLELYKTLSLEVRMSLRNCYHLTDSEIYYTADKGIVKYHLKNDGNSYVECDTLYRYGVNDAIITGNSTVVATNKLGLDIVRNGKHHFYTIANGLPSNNINKLYYDSGYIWASTNQGLARLQLNEEDSIIGITNFSHGNVLISGEVYDATILGKDVYAATAKGITVFKKDLGFQYIPPVYVHQVQVNNDDSIFRDNITLAYDQNNIAITFRAISFGSNKDILYRYMLEGADEGFQNSKEDNVRYAALKPGTYTFSVYARTENSQWNTVPASISFVIAPPYWLTWWFITLECFSVLLILSIVLIIYFRARQRRTEFEKKMVESELRSLRLHINPHFVFNSLTSLQSYVLSDRAEQASIMISRFAGLIRSFMYYSQKGEIKLKDEMALLSEYIEMEQIRFKGQFDYKITVDQGIDIYNTIIPSLLIQPFVENAIKHGLTGLDRKGMLLVHFCKENDLFYCIVKDNGRGRIQNAQTNGAKHSLHESTGILFTTERIRLIMDDPHMVVLKMTDLYTEDLPAGLEVKILVPMI